MSNTRKIMMRAAVSGVAVAGAAAIILPTFTAHAEAPEAECEVTELSGLDEGTSAATSVDSSGTYVAGYSQNADQRQAATLWQDGEAQAVELEGAVESHLVDVNANGEAVGMFRGATGPEQPFLHNKDKTLPIPVPGDAEGMEVTGINDEGLIVGTVTMSKTEYYPVALDPQTLDPVQLDIPDGAVGKAIDVDNSGNIGGHADVLDGEEADGEQLPYVWNAEGAGEPLPGTEGEGIDFSLSAYQEGWAIAGNLEGPDVIWEPDAEGPAEYEGMLTTFNINGSGQIVGMDGELPDPDPVPATGTADGEVTELPVPDGYAGGRADDISDDGAIIVGQADGESADTAVLWTCG